MKAPTLNTRNPKTLKQWQLEGLQYLAKRGLRGGYLAMEMRLGKTLTAVEHVETLIRPTPERPCLIAAPNSVTRTWANELRDFGQNDFAILSGDWKERVYTLKEGAAYIICNFEGLIPSRVLSAKNWKSVVADEALCIANPKALVSKYMTGGYVTEHTSEMRKDGKKKRRTIPRYEKPRDCTHIALCGNPMPESPLQIFQQMKFVQGSIGGVESYWEFTNNYYTVSGDGHSLAPKSGTEEMIYNFFHANAFIRTRKECNVGSEKVYAVRRVQMSPAQRKAYTSMKTHFEADGVSADLSLIQMEYLSQIADGQILGKAEYRSLAKFKEVIYLLDGELCGQFVLIWCRYTKDIAQMSKMLHLAGYTNDVIHGGVDPDEREKIRVRFQEKKIRAVVMQIQTGKRGLDFSNGDASIYLNNVWSADARAQSEDRLIHILKSQDKLIIDIVTEDTIEEDIKEICAEKGAEGQFFMNKLLWRMNHG